MIEGVTVLSGRDAVLAVAGGHPYARLATGGDGVVAGYAVGGTVVWTVHAAWGTSVCGLGDGAVAAGLVDHIAAAGRLGGAGWLHLPRLGPDVAPPAPAGGRRDDWDFRWTTVAPPVRPGEDAAVRLTGRDLTDVEALVSTAFPDSTTRPGDPRVRHWWGLRVDGRLVACGADRSRGGIGFLAGLTVHPRCRGRGLGAALTATMTRALLAEYDTVSLGVMQDNHPAQRLYRSLGFGSAVPRTSLGTAA